MLLASNDSSVRQGTIIRKNGEQDAVFIVASGPSARDFPIERFADVPMITMNGAISMFARTSIQPFCYACTDKDFPRQQPQLFSEAVRRSQRLAVWNELLDDLPAVSADKVLPLKKAGPPSLLRTLLRRERNLVRGGAFWSRRARSLGFSKDLSQGFFDARTVAYLALQIAYHAGFKKVFLVGVDLDQAAGRFYEANPSDPGNSPCGLDQHFQRRILPSLQIMADKVVGEDFAVYNLSARSLIPDRVIPKVSLAQVEGMLNA